jgi:uncharacterized protein
VIGRKSKRYYLLLIFFLLSLPLTAYSLDVPRLQGYVNDYAGMISSPAKSKIEDELRAFEQSDSTQIVILTIPSLEGENLEEFSIKVGETWKIGQQGKDNGILFIVSNQERRIRVEVGRGLEGSLTDLMAGRIIDQVIKPRFKQGDFDGGFIAGVSAIINATRGEFQAEERPAQRRQSGFPPFLTFLMFLGIFTLIFGSFSRVLGGIVGAIGLPSIVNFGLLPIGLPLIIFLALFGFGSGFFLPSLFSLKGPRRGGHRNHRGGFFFGPGIGGFSAGGGGFSGGGGSFGGGGASGGW